MKQIINHKLYNTETAKELHTRYHGNGWSDLYGFSETLYQKRTGEFFLHGDGGPGSKYSVSVGCNSWSGTQKIIPISEEEARDWAERYMDADDYMELFGPVEE